MKVSFNLSEKDLLNILKNAELALLKSPELKYSKDKSWRDENIPKLPGVYMFFNVNGDILYIGESANLNDRIGEVGRTVNHSFRRKIGKIYFHGTLNKYKFDEIVEKKIDDFFQDNVYVTTLPINFGRLELEAFLIKRYSNKIVNSIKVR